MKCCSPAAEVLGQGHDRVVVVLPAVVLDEIDPAILLLVVALWAALCKTLQIEEKFVPVQRSSFCICAEAISLN